MAVQAYGKQPKASSICALSYYTASLLYDAAPLPYRIMRSVYAVTAAANYRMLLWYYIGAMHGHNAGMRYRTKALLYPNTRLTYYRLPLLCAHFCMAFTSLRISRLLRLLRSMVCNLPSLRHSKSLLRLTGMSSTASLMVISSSSSY